MAWQAEQSAHLACFVNTLAASLTVAGGTLGAHALRAAHSSLCPSAHAAFCAAREEYLANLQPEHLQQVATKIPHGSTTYTNGLDHLR